MARRAIIQAPRRAVVLPKKPPKPAPKETVRTVNGKKVAPPKPKPGYKLIPGTPATPGVKNKRADPFLTPDQQMDVFNQENNWTGDIGDAEDAFADLQNDDKLQTENINRQRDAAVRATQENMAARGLFRSSLKDTALIDTEKAAEQQRTAIDNMLITAKGRLEALRVSIAGQREAFGKITNDMAIGNAEDINSNLPEYSTEPTPGSGPTQVKNNAAGKKKQQNHKPAAAPKPQMPLTRTRPVQSPLYGRPKPGRR